MNIFDYIKKVKRGTEARNLEKETLHDPFLAEAMEGFEQVKGDHDRIVARLQKRVHRRAKRRRVQQPKFLWSGIVLALFIILFLAFYFLAGLHIR